MQFRLYHYYRTRDGRKAQVVGIWTEEMDELFRVEEIPKDDMRMVANVGSGVVARYKLNGKYHADEQPCGYDLVAEWG